MNFQIICLLIAREVRKTLGEKSLNELIVMAISVYEEVFDKLADQNSRAILTLPPADPEIVNAVMAEINAVEHQKGPSGF